MIRAVFTHNRLTVDGHAGYAPHGQDIVCAAASALLFALAADLEERGALRELTMQPGHISVASKGEEAAAFRLIRCGLGQLAARYPQCVKIESGGNENGNEFTASVRGGEHSCYGGF